MYGRVTPLIKQSWIASGVLLMMLAQGMILSYPSCLLPALLSGEDQIQIDIHIASWLGSSVGVSAIPGVLLSSLLMEWWGRRFAQAAAVLPSVAGWLLIYFSNNVPTLMVGRVFGGISSGATVILSAIAIGEYTSPEHRGMFLNLKTAAVCLGNTIVHALGYYFHWKTVALFSLVPCLISFIIVCTWPESPAWLLSKGQFENSEKSFYWLRGHNEMSKNEIDDMLVAQKERLASQSTHQTCAEKTKDFFNKFKRKDFLKPIAIIFLGAVLIEACGRHIFPAYTSQIIGEITGDRTQLFYYTLALDLIIMASATFSSGLVKVMRRRTLLFSTGLASLAVLAIVCVYLYLVSIDVLSRTRTWIPQFLFVVYFILVSQGCTPIPLTFTGELLPLAHRGVGSTVSGVMLALTLMVALQVCPYLLDSVGVHGTFTVFGAVMAASLLCLYFILPETKDKTLQEIEDYFTKRKLANKPDEKAGDTPRQTTAI